MSIKLNARKHGLPIALGDKRTLKLSAHSIEIAYDEGRRYRGDLAGSFFEGWCAVSGEAAIGRKL